MTDTLSIDALRKVGMKLVVAMSAILAAVIVVATALVSTEGKWPAAALALALMVYPVILVLGHRIDGAARMTVSITVVAMPALLLFVSEGQPWQTDLHMLFFALLAGASILCDWKALLAATVVVAVHHLGVGMINPLWLFGGSGSFGRIMLHAVILIIESCTLMWVAQRIIALIDANGVQTVERERASAALSAERAEQAKSVASVTGALGQALGALARGDLTQRIGVAFPDGYAVLKDDYHTAVASLQTMIASVTDTAEGIRSGTNEIATASEDLARRTESNAASLEQASAALVQIDGRLTATARASSNTVKRADQAIATVRSGRGTAGSAVAAMSRVSVSAKGIDSVIEGVDKIAFQTRVLAMNAAVEAGRAGDAGRGFAVVADLVSALAMRAEEEAKRARDQLSVTQSEIVTAVEAVEAVDGSLAAIAIDVDAVHGLLGSMTADNVAQAQAITEITAAIGSMDRATQQNAAMVEETSAATHTLAGEVDALTATTAAFETGQHNAASTTAPRPVIAVPARSATPRKTVKRVSGGGRTVTATADWANF